MKVTRRGLGGHVESRGSVRAKKWREGRQADCPRQRAGGSSDGPLQDGRHRCIARRTRCGPRVEHVLGCVRPGSVPTTAWCRPAPRTGNKPVPSHPRCATEAWGRAVRPCLKLPNTRAGYGLPPCAREGRRGAGLPNSHRCQVSHTHTQLVTQNGVLPSRQCS